MRILTVHNSIMDIDDLPDAVNDVSFGVMDNSDPEEPDFLFPQLIFLESFNCPAIVMTIGKYKLKMPLDWHIVVGDAEQGDLEALQLTAINGREFSAFVFNPLSSYRPEFWPIEIKDVYTDFKWYFPKMRPGQYLAVPLGSGSKPPCVYLTKDVTKFTEVIKYAKIW